MTNDEEIAALRAVVRLYLSTYAHTQTHPTSIQEAAVIVAAEAAIKLANRRDQPASDALGHRTRFSDASSYDEVCVLCGATDRRDDPRLKSPCSFVDRRTP